MYIVYSHANFQRDNNSPLNYCRYVFLQCKQYANHNENCILLKQLRCVCVSLQMKYALMQRAGKLQTQFGKTSAWGFINWSNFHNLYESLAVTHNGTDVYE